jgi:hypothetical protein
MKQVFIYKSDITELRDLEDETLEYFNNDTVNNQKLEMLSRVLTKYADILSGFSEFYEVQSSIISLVDTVEKADFDSMSNIQKESFCSFCRSLIVDLCGWRTSIFVNKNVTDIHWLDDSIVAQVAQLEVILSPLQTTSIDKVSIELF